MDWRVAAVLMSFATLIGVAIFVGLKFTNKLTKAKAVAVKETQARVQAEVKIEQITSAQRAKDMTDEDALAAFKRRAGTRKRGGRGI